MGNDRDSLRRDAVITLVAVVLAFLALDDITTDTDTSFLLERMALVGCAVWFASLAVRLTRRGWRVLGPVSFAIVIAAAVAQPNIGPGTIPSFAPSYVATYLSLAWFLFVSGVLAVRAMPSPRRYAA